MISVQVVRAPIRIQPGSNEIPRISRNPVMSTIRPCGTRSPRAGKKSVPPARTVEPAPRAERASSRVFGLRYTDSSPEKRATQPSSRFYLKPAGLYREGGQRWAGRLPGNRTPGVLSDIRGIDKESKVCQK